MSRAKTAARGYGAQHQALRAALAERMTHGETFDCWRCGQPIAPGQRWDLGHDDHDRTIYRGPEHLRCNRATNRRGRPRNCRTLTPAPTSPTPPTVRQPPTAARW